MSRRAVLAGSAVTALHLSAARTLVRAAPAGASRIDGAFEELLVPSSMGPITVQIQWASRGGSAALFLLDGLRARPDSNGWALANAHSLFNGDDVTIVMPVGGQSSFYADWAGPSQLNGQVIPYRWETFLTSELPDFLARYGVSRSGNAIAGLSMGAGAAVALAAAHSPMFAHVSAFSGAMDWRLPGMKELLRLAALQGGGFDLTALAPADSAAWLRMDPWTVAPQLLGIGLYVSAATGVPGAYDGVSSLDQLATTSSGMLIEAVSCATTHSFQQRLDSLGIPAIFDYPAVGTHRWRYWIDSLAAARPHILDALAV